MMVRRAVGLAILLCVAGILWGAAAAAGQASHPDAAFAVPRPAVPIRDTVIRSENTAAAQASASGPSGRYPVNDGRGRSVQITVSTLCLALCTAADPQQIANFLGTLVHADEMNVLNVELLTDSELGTSCGSGALSCYFSDQDTIMLSGNNETASDGATRDYVLAHEYGHHVATHRRNPPWDALSYGPKYWATSKRICPGVRAGTYYPGAEQPRSHYYANPGEAFAESFAQNRFPGLVHWEWTPTLQPNAADFAALDRDALDPWSGRSPATSRVHLAPERDTYARTLRTPLDGTLSVQLSAPPGSRYRLAFRSLNRRRLARAGGGRPGLSFTVCGQRRLRLIVTRISGARRFRLTVLAP